MQPNFETRQPLQGELFDTVKLIHNERTVSATAGVQCTHESSDPDNPLLLFYSISEPDRLIVTLEPRQATLQVITRKNGRKHLLVKLV